MGILNIVDVVKEEKKKIKKVETTTEDVEDENVQSGSDNRGSGVAFLYMIVTILVYFLVVKILGNKDSILQVFITNAWGDVSGGTTRSMTQTMLANFISNGNFSNGESNNFYSSILENFLLEFPIVFSFSIIDSFVRKRIKGNSKIIIAFTFIAGYVLQSIIGIAYSEPVSFNTDRIFWCMIICGIITSIAFYVIPLKRKRESIEVDEMKDNIKKNVKYMIYTYIIEFFKAVIMMFCFTMLAVFIITISITFKFNLLIRLFSVISPFIFLLFYEGISYAGDTIGTDFANAFLHFLKIDSNTIEKNSKFGELYCLAFVGLMLIYGVVYHLIKS